MPRLDSNRLLELAEAFEAGASIRELRDRYKLGNKALLRYAMKSREQNLVTGEALGRLLVDETRYEFPQDPDVRLEAILSSINTELKVAALLMIERYPQTCSDIRNRLAELTHTPLPCPATFREYCTYTFSPIGFLVQQRFGRGLGLADSYFTLTDAGEMYQPTAAFALSYAVDHGVSLYSLLAQTQSSGDLRAPFTRAEIVRHLDEGADTIAGSSNRLVLLDLL